MEDRYVNNRTKVLYVNVNKNESKEIMLQCHARNKTQCRSSACAGDVAGEETEVRRPRERSIASRKHRRRAWEQEGVQANPWRKRSTCGVVWSELTMRG